MIDFIGDIHGFADQLQALLRRLGYQKSNGTYSHPHRTAFFIGDYIDRGPKIRETIEIVRSMVESKNALALMGNHEYNALRFHMVNPDGGHLQKRSIKNIIQHNEPLKDFENGQKQYEEHLEWFKTLPLFYECEQFRAVHACWDNEQIDYLKKTLINDRLSDETIRMSIQKGTKFNQAVDQTLNGKKVKLPAGSFFIDRSEKKRTELRIKWWEDPTMMSYKSLSVEPISDLPEYPIELSELSSPEFYSEQEKMVFFGHYWLAGKPSLFRKNVCCLDYSVAKKGKLVAYRLNDEKALTDGGFVYL